ncbi:MAG: T9SS type A sorting domain-containing protein [Bacteroidetes bacterium]|nr:T9SS type A sorting domain-containing protein [Bacteroidota bacterium]
MDFYSGNILLGTMGNGIYTRPEASGSWTQNNLGLTNLNVTSVTVNNQNKMFAGTDGNGVFVSDLSSISWSTTSVLVNSFTTTMGLDGNNIQAMGYYYGYAFASVRGTVHATSDNGVTWEEAGTQFNFPSYADIGKLSFVTTRLFATTPNNCLYSQGLSELPNVLSISEISANSGIHMYPNPSNGNLTFTYDNHSEKTVELLVYDELGNQVAKYNSPIQKISLNCSRGIYFLKLTTNKRVVSQKIIIN